MIKERNTVIIPIIFQQCCCRSICSQDLSGGNPGHSRFCPQFFGQLHSLLVPLFVSILDLSSFCVHNGFKKSNLYI